MKKRLGPPAATGYQLYCRDANSFFTAEVAVLGKASTGITAPEYVSFMRNGQAWTGFLKKDENEINENDIEFVLARIGHALSVPMAEVLRTYEDPLYTRPHSIISISVASKKNERFISFSDMQDELFLDLRVGAIAMTPWLGMWMRIRKRRDDAPSGIWEIYATSMDDCEACFQYPFEIAGRWTHKHGLRLIHFDRSVLKMVMFDILVGQTDRTPGNYGLLVDWGQGTAKLAPLFDNATLRKPGMSESLNGFNYLLIDRTAFVMAAYRKWKAAFLSGAVTLLCHENEIFDVIDSSASVLPKDKLHFLKKRIRGSLDLLKRFVKDSVKYEELLGALCGDETLFHTEMKRLFFKHGIYALRVERLGEIGWEPKYRVDTVDRSYFVKFSLYDRFSKGLHELMTEALHHTQSVLVPLISQNVPSIDRQINIYPWIDGIDLRKVIRSKSLEECYRMGVRCGKLLRNIHSSAITTMQGTYDIDDRIDAWLEVLSCTDGILTRRHSYFPQIHRWRELLRRRYQPTLVHMDYSPKNIMISGDALLVVDWDSCAVADPWLDFFDKGLALYPERQALNAGMIDGYFCGDIPAGFWPYFKALSVFALLQSAVWAIDRNDIAYVDQIELHVCESYEGFERDIPTWYEKSPKVGYSMSLS